MTEPAKSTAYSLRDLQQESHDRAVRKGFYDPPPTIEQRIALIHSEISEADEALDEHDPADIWHTSKGKPEGAPIEVADIVIRIADFCGYVGADLDDALASSALVFRYGHNDELIRLMHRHASRALECHRKVDKDGLIVELGVVTRLCFLFANTNGFDLWAAIRAKSDFNESREHKHGKAY